MYVISVQGVNEAYAQGLEYLCKNGELQGSRAGEVLVAPTPVTIVYEKPQERVLFDPSRDANPAFHMMEALWMLAGRNDACWLDQFVKDFSSRFAEDDGHQHGAYGFRWKQHFDMEGGGNPNLPDQLDTVIRILKSDPESRRAVLQMWDPVADLGVSKRDLPCNVCVFLRVRTERDYINGNWVNRQLLDIMVCCRSNDFVYGAVGANSVHFAFLQEYLAGRIGVEIGTYTQCAFNMHIYTSILPKLNTPEPVVHYPSTQSIGTVWDAWDSDLDKFMAWTSLTNPANFDLSYRNAWFKNTAEPMFMAYFLWRTSKDKRTALNYLDVAENMAADWRKAGMAWMQRRIEKSMTKKENAIVSE